jgi:hypothetical protein
MREVGSPRVTFPCIPGTLRSVVSQSRVAISPESRSLTEAAVGVVVGRGDAILGSCRRAGVRNFMRFANCRR